jgi:hypothetical protein
VTSSRCRQSTGMRGLGQRDLRKAFAQALRGALQRARLGGRIDYAQSEELWRVVPNASKRNA